MEITRMSDNKISSPEEFFKSINFGIFTVITINTMCFLMSLGNALVNSFDLVVDFFSN